VWGKEKLEWVITNVQIILIRKFTEIAKYLFAISKRTADDSGRPV
jgi:hypothetical protein